MYSTETYTITVTRYVYGRWLVCLKPQEGPAYAAEGPSLGAAFERAYRVAQAARQAPLKSDG
jgi:hypothetical protein